MFVIRLVIRVIHLSDDCILHLYTLKNALNYRLILRFIPVLSDDRVSVINNVSAD